MDLPSTHASWFLSLQADDPSQKNWTAFHARYHDIILVWCRRRNLPSDCAEDVAQEIWVKLLHDIRKYDPAKGRFRSWLKAVVNNALTDYWRRQCANPERGGVGGTIFLERLAALASPEAADELSLAMERQADNAAAEMLARVRVRLKDSTWQAFYQTLIEHRSAKDVAAELGMSIAAVYKDTYRVKKMLYEEYRNVFPDDQGPNLSGRDQPPAISE